MDVKMDERIHVALGSYRAVRAGRKTHIYYRNASTTLRTAGAQAARSYSLSLEIQQAEVVMVDPTALQDEIVTLRRRIEALVAERDEFAQQSAELFVLQQVFTTMNSTLEIDDILSTVLRGIAEALRFGRVIFFDVTDAAASRRLETDASGSVIPSPDPADHLTTPAFLAMIAGASEFLLGSATDGEAPLRDSRGTFCMLPLISRNTVRGILYVDDPPNTEIVESQVRVLLDFAAQAAIALENARLYTETKRLLEESSAWRSPTR
ncbi:MAG: hypothetical protein NVSMB64_03530 [Candidatus Velthaea sp.]